MFTRTGFYCCLLLLAVTACSCDKVDIAFGNTGTSGDPNITYYDNFAVDIATYKPDSFITSGHNLLAAGYHHDTALGVMQAGTYLQLALPGSNPLLHAAVAYDSLELLLYPNGQFYGDSIKPFTVQAFRLTQNISSDAGDVYYNTSSFGYNNTAIAKQSISLNSKTGSVVAVRISDVLGKELFDKFKSGDDVIGSSEKFTDYFRGLFITADSTQTGSVAYFTATADSPVVRLHYHTLGLFAEKKQFDFTYTTAKQFNHITTRFTNAAYTALNTAKTLLEPATSSGNRAIFSTGFAGAVKITFPGLLSLKEQHPYIKVVKALLVIRPDTRSAVSPYRLPDALYLYKTDDSNQPGAGIFETGSTSLQTGSLVIDNLYGENTYYSYDITSFINEKITEGQFSQSALLLNTSLSYADAGMQRLFINNQQNSRPIQLKLFLLGL